MLSDDQMQLLTAYLDGEITERQRQVVLRLLHQSSEARELVRQLQENAHKLKQLPRRTLEPAFAEEVVNLIIDRRLIPTMPVRRLAVRRRWTPYAVAGMAAAVLLGIGAGTAFYFGGNRHIEQQAKVEPLPHPPLDAGKGHGDETSPVVSHKPPNPLISRMIEGVYGKYAVQMPAERAMSFRVAELKQEPVAKQVAAELKKDESLQLDLTVRNNPAAMDRLRAILHKHKVDLLVDPGTGTAMQQAPAKTELLVYTENLNPAEWEQILKELSQEQPAANPFEKVTVAALAPRERQQVTELLGTDPTTRVDPNARKGIKNPQNNAKPPVNKVNRVAVVLPQTPQANASDEVRRFLLQPALPEPGSVRVLVRIRVE